MDITARKNAARLLRGHRTRMARATARQIQATVVRYREMDATVLERNIITLLGAVEHLLESGDDQPLLGIMESVVQIRTLGGFSSSQFLMAVLCYLPVCRRFLLERSGNHAEALAAYDAVEELALPFMGRVVELFQQSDSASSEEQAGRAVEAFFKNAAAFKPARIERVTGEESDERR